MTVHCALGWVRKGEPSEGEPLFLQALPLLSSRLSPAVGSHCPQDLHLTTESQHRLPQPLGHCRRLLAGAAWIPV